MMRISSRFSALYTWLFILFTIMATGLGDCQLAMASAYDPVTFEPTAKSVREDFFFWFREKKPNVIESVDEVPYHVRVGTDFREFEYVMEKSDETKSLTFLPNSGQYLTVSVADSRTFGLSYSQNVSTSEDPVIYGDTQFKDFRLELPFTKWVFSASYAQYKGFYINKSDNENTVWKSEKPHLLPNMSSRTLALRATYVAVPHRFSLPALIAQTARQTASGGSTLLSLSYRHETIDNNQPFVPAAVSEYYLTGQINQLSHVSTDSLLPSIGYGYQYNFTKSFGIIGAISYGAGFAKVRRNVGTEQSAIKGATKTDGEVALVYNGTKYYSGLRTNAESLLVEGNSIDTETTLRRTQIYFGGRF
jgi:hypothetical protein